MNNIDWKALVVNAKAGDDQTYKNLLDSCAQLLRAYLSRRLKNPELLEDVLQESLLAIHVSFHTLKEESKFKSWMYSVCRFTMIAFFRRNKMELVDITSLESYISDEFDLENYISSKQELDLALSEIKEDEREILIKLKLEKQSIDEIAKELNTSAGALRVRLSRINKKVRNILEKNNYEY